MKKLVVGLMGTLMLITTSAFACDDYLVDDNNHWAHVVQISDYTYHIMVSKDYLPDNYDFSPGTLGAYAIHTVCDMPSGSVYTPPPNNLAAIDVMSGSDGAFYAGYLNGYDPDVLNSFD